MTEVIYQVRMLRVSRSVMYRGRNTGEEVLRSEYNLFYIYKYSISISIYIILSKENHVYYASCQRGFRLTLLGCSSSKISVSVSNCHFLYISTLDTHSSCKQSHRACIRPALSRLRVRDLSSNAYDLCEHRGHESHYLTIIPLNSC